MSARRDLISRLNFLRSGILADDGLPARGLHLQQAPCCNGWKTYQTQPSNSHVTLWTICVASKHSVHLADQASTCTQMGWESMTTTWHITGLRPGHAALRKTKQKRTGTNGDDVPRGTTSLIPLACESDPA